MMDKNCEVNRFLDSQINQLMVNGAARMGGFNELVTITTSLKFSIESI